MLPESKIVSIELGLSRRVCSNKKIESLTENILLRFLAFMVKIPPGC